MMMKTKSVPASEQRARILLSAWNSGDLGRLQKTLTEDWSAREAAGWGGLDERERMEMLVTIAEAMRNWLRRGGCWVGRRAAGIGNGRRS